MTNAFTIGYEIIFSVLLVVFLFRAVAQLHTIVRIHREATNVNLYEIEPHSAFSRFTLRTSIAITVPYAFATVIAGIAEGIAPLEVVLFSLFLLISVALFVLPLSGMHRRLVQEKSRLIGESDRRFETINARLHRQVDSDQLERIEELEKALSALTIEADRLRKISTWPWRADTLRIFLSSIALPIVLWTITTLLSRVI